MRFWWFELAGDRVLLSGRYNMSAENKLKLQLNLHK